MREQYWTWNRYHKTLFVIVPQDNPIELIPKEQLNCFPCMQYPYSPLDYLAMIRDCLLQPGGDHRNEIRDDYVEPRPDGGCYNISGPQEKKSK